MLSEEIGNNIRKARQGCNLTQAQLAYMMNTKQPRISRIEKGIDLPNLDYLSRIAEVLGKKVKLTIT